MQVITFYKSNVKSLRIVQGTCCIRTFADLIKFENFIFFRNFSSQNFRIFSKFLVILTGKKLSCLEMILGPSWVVWAINLFFKKIFFFSKGRIEWQKMWIFYKCFSHFDWKKTFISRNDFRTLLNNLRYKVIFQKNNSFSVEVVLSDKNITNVTFVKIQNPV